MADERRRPMRRWLRILLGIVFTILGIIGLILPAVPQIPFFITAALLLAPDFPPARRFAVWGLRKWPWLRRKIPRKYRYLHHRKPT